MKIILSLALLALCGCANVTGSRVAPDGSKLQITSTRFFWSSEGIQFTLADTNGFRTTLSVQRSSVDAAAIQAVAAGVVQGMAQSMK